MFEEKVLRYAQCALRYAIFYILHDGFVTLGPSKSVIPPCSPLANGGWGDLDGYFLGNGSIWPNPVQKGIKPRLKLVLFLVVRKKFLSGTQIA
jgi:hypothetical protein